MKSNIVTITNRKNTVTHFKRKVKSVIEANYIGAILSNGIKPSYVVRVNGLPMKGAA